MKGRCAATWLLGGLLSWMPPAFAHDTGLPHRAVADRGDLVLDYAPAATPTLARVRRSLQSTGFFDDLVADLNGLFALPRNIAVVFEACDEANAFYDLETGRITLCYELAHEFVKVFGKDGAQGEAYDEAVIDAVLFTFFHELGHALVHQLDLPVTGREEDAVDEFATIFLTEVYDDDAGALSGLWQFDVEAEEEMAQLEALTYWGEHSLSAQRFYDTACLIYGSDPQGYGFLVEESHLPEERAGFCQDDFERKSRTWFRLLGAWLRE